MNNVSFSGLKIGKETQPYVNYFWNKQPKDVAKALDDIDKASGNNDVFLKCYDSLARRGFSLNLGSPEGPEIAKTNICYGRAYDNPSEFISDLNSLKKQMLISPKFYYE